MQNLITNHLDIWASAHKTRSTAGRGSNNKLDLYGIKKLRELILELAVRGKLVPQDANDEPACELLKKIATEKAKLIKKGKLKNERPFPEIGEYERPFEIPSSWEWKRLPEVYYSISPSLNKLKSSLISDEGELPVVDQGQSFIAGYTNEIGLTINIPNPVIVFGDHTTNLKYIDFDFVAGADGTKILSPIVIFERYFYTYLKSYKLENRGYARHFKVLNDNLIALPPLPEQHRIVAKVDELMAFCDQLEQTQSDNIAAHAQLVEALLTTLTNSSDHNELQNNWQRIAAHFDTLFTTEHSIDQLKQTILQLAVMGKLVSQNPNDEPASELLKKIAAEKAQLIKEGKIKKEKPLPEITDEEKPFELPSGWEWIKFGYIAEFINGDRGKNYPNVSEYVDQGIAWINTGHIEPNGTLTSSNMNYITRDKFDSLRGGKIQVGDLVYCLRGATFGKTAFVTPYSEGAIASSLMIIRPYIQELNLFIYRYLISNTGRSQIFRFDNGSAQPNLSAGNVMLYAFPLPPIEEQHRIVAKVDELMALCDTLKTNLQNAQTTQLALADALVEQAVG